MSLKTKMKTLKELHESKRLYRVKNTILKIDQKILQENYDRRLLIEALDENDLETASAIIDKLRKIKGKGIKTLDAAIERAEAEINKYTGGGALTQAWNSLKTRFGVDNPLIKMMAFASSLETGFKQLPVILKNNVGQITDENSKKTINDLVTDAEKKKIIAKNLLSALSPKGFFGTLGKIPYVDSQKLIIDMMSVPLENLTSVARETTSGPQTQEIAKDLQASLAKGGDVETKKSAQTQPAEQPAQTRGTEPAKPTTAATQTTPAGETPPREQNQDKRTLARQLGRAKKEINALPNKNTDDIIKILNKYGLIKTA